MAVEQLARGEGRPGLEADLPAALDSAHPGLVDGDHPTAEGDLGALAAMAHGTAGRVVAALCAGDLSDLSRQELREDVEAHVDRRCEQAVAHVGGEHLELALHLVGQGSG